MPVHTTQKEFLAAVEATIRRHRMLDPGEAVVVGVSGGPDSVALLHTLVALGAKWSLSLTVAHLNHQLRGITADQEAAFVKRLAKRLEVSCEMGSEDVASYAAGHRVSNQEAARTLRYAFFERVAVKCGATKIALGHQADDNVESILMHLLRGTGPRGLAGIPPVRDSRIIRPLIDLTRAQILAFLKQSKLEYVRDQSNLDPKYLRNRVRWELVPFLGKNFNPKVASGLTRLASILRDEEDFWDQQVDSLFQDRLLQQKQDCLTLSAHGLRRLHPALLRRLVRYTVSALMGDLERLGHNHVEAVIRLATGSTPSGPLNLPKGVRVIHDGGQLTFFLGRPEEKLRFAYEITGPGTILIPETSVCLRVSIFEVAQVGEPQAYPSNTALFDLSAVSFPLLVRTFKEGDRFKPLGMSGSQKVKTFFINQKIPRRVRGRCPLLLSGGKIIWVGGYRIDDSVKLTKKTEMVLKAELFPEGSKG